MPARVEQPPNTAPREHRDRDDGCEVHRTPFGQSGSLRGLGLVPAKWRCLVPPGCRAVSRHTSGYPTREEHSRGR
jgi:hypothetical protein